MALRVLAWFEDPLPPVPLPPLGVAQLACRRAAVGALALRGSCARVAAALPIAALPRKRPAHGYTNSRRLGIEKEEAIVKGLVIVFVQFPASRASLHP